VYLLRGLTVAERQITGKHWRRKHYYRKNKRQRWRKIFKERNKENIT
jgi:hypothetical protein